MDDYPLEVAGSGGVHVFSEIFIEEGSARALHHFDNRGGGQQEQGLDNDEIFIVGRASDCCFIVGIEWG